MPSLLLYWGTIPESARSLLSVHTAFAERALTIPAEAFTIDRENYRLVLNVDKETLKNAEGFDPNNWPDTADRVWGQRIHDFYGFTPYWDRR